MRFWPPATSPPRNRPHLSAAGWIACLLLLPPAYAQSAAADQLLRAMHDEIERSNQLRIVSPDVPYFVQYRVFDGGSYTATALSGALVQSDTRELRLGEVMVRVGDYKFDNGNYAIRRGGNGLNVRLQSMVLDDSYKEYRRMLWLGTDEAFKDAMEAIAAKRAALKNLKVMEELPDFAGTAPVKLLQPKSGRPVDGKVWEARVKELSGLLRESPIILDVSATFQHTVSTFYLANTEGTEVRSPGEVASLRVRAQGQAPDGAVLRDQMNLAALSVDKLPDAAAMKKRVEELGNRLQALAAAPFGDAYIGPVLFEGEAAPQLFAQLLAANLSLSRRPITDPGTQFPFQPSEFDGRIGSRILPEWITVVDDPLRKEWQGHPLIGHYEVDLEGVVPAPLTLVAKGVLRDVLRSRQPVKGYDSSNGRGRLPSNYGVVAAAPSNLIITAAESLPRAELRRRLLELVQQRQKPYGLIVRRLDFPTSADLGDLQRLLVRGMQGGGGSRPLSPPVLVCRVYPDGREELVRGIQFRNLNARALREILAASSEQTVFHYFNTGAPLAFSGFGGIVAETSVIAPDILLEEVEFEEGDRQLPTLPLVPPPTLRDLN